ncbi:MAG: SMC-Scp complex subunit ScpB [Thermoguttaceae bacterium]|nr:SMC-Scp complex subunit ScpB [Thermoguttaceae bacterium]
MSEGESSKTDQETKRTQNAVSQSVLRIVPSEEAAGKAGETEFFHENETFSSPSSLHASAETSSQLSQEDEDVDDAFFAKSFALNSERRESEQTADAFANGLRSLFEDNESDDVFVESDSARFQREIETERRESLDGVLRQGDADFLADAGKKYDSPHCDRDVQESSSTPQSFFESSLDEKTQGAKIRPESILEAMLFVGNRDNNPLTLKSACELMRDVSESEAQEALFALNERYRRDGSPYRIVRDGEGYRMTLCQKYSDFVSRFNDKAREFKLSQTAVDVLSLIAYRQPIALEEILEVRNNAGSALAQLVKRELVTQEKQVLDKKKVTFYKTTNRFLKLFNLESLDDLPIVGDIDYR